MAANPARTRAARVRALVEPVIEQLGFEVEDLSVSQAGRRSLLRVVVDRDGGVSLDDVAVLSNAASAVLDEADADLVGSMPYTLEVTSPGIDRPLVVARHWQRNVGRLVHVYVGEWEITGRVTAADDEKITFDIEGEVQQFAIAELGPGKVQVEFDRKEG